MNSNFSNKLKKFRYLQPDADFARRSRDFIVGAHRISYRAALLRRYMTQMITISAAMAMAVLLLFTLSSVSQLQLKGLSPDSVSSLNQEALEIEKENLNFGIHLSEARYFKESTNQITMILQAVSRNSSSVADQEIIKKQAENLNELAKSLTL